VLFTPTFILRFAQHHNSVYSISVSFRSACLYHAIRPQEVTFEAEKFSVLTASPSDQKDAARIGGAQFSQLWAEYSVARFKRRNIDETQPTATAAISAFETLAGAACLWSRQKAFYATHGERSRAGFMRGSYN
jgi:hypothetical protein